MSFYDGTRLLSLMDINGEKPEIYICTSNRSAGKTTYFGRLLVNRFLDGGEKFGLVYRFNYELDNCAEKFFKDIGDLFFTGHDMENKPRAKGKFHELFLDGVSCGYVFALNDADQIKKYSHFFSDIKRLLFDEFQSETGHYCPGEVQKLISIHISIARGGGKQSRYLPVYMVSNPVTILNPYYIELGVTERLKSDTRFLRGEGYVLEQGYNEGAAGAQKGSAFNRAFKTNRYIGYAAQAIYLNDNTAFIEKPRGTGHYLVTLKYEGKDYAVREFPDSGIVYCDDKPDLTFPRKITVTTADHNVNYVMLRRSSIMIASLRYYFDHGAFRFKNMKCKEAILKALSY